MIINGYLNVTYCAFSGGEYSVMCGVGVFFALLMRRICCMGEGW